MADEIAYPEHNKLKEIKHLTQHTGEFLDWLTFKGLRICTWSEDLSMYLPHHQSVQALLAEYFEIDVNKLDLEKRQMLDEMIKKR